MDNLNIMRPVWAEIDLTIIGHNLMQFRKMLPKETRIMAVVKADAYGHGAAEVAGKVLREGADSLAVALTEEGIKLREAGIKAPILVFGYSAPELGYTLLKYNLMPTIFDLLTAEAFEKSLSASACKLTCHVKIDTGMGRVGVSKEEALTLVKKVSGSQKLQLEGIYTHFATADEEDRSFTLLQIERFNRVIDACLNAGLNIPVIHAANSAAAMAYPEARYNLVRLGLAIYGCYPSPFLKNNKIELLPALSLKSRIIFLKEVPANTPISYGSTYRTSKESLIATVPLGYADGYMRSFSNCGLVLVKGVVAPVVGRVCMDQIMIDITGLHNAACGDEVVIYGKQDRQELKVDDMAAYAGTINYELLTAISKRVPRFYNRNSEP